MLRRLRLNRAQVFVLIGSLGLFALYVVVATAGSRLVETLHSPVEVLGWTPSGLRLRDGRIVPIPGVSSLPASSPALSEATKRGVEIADDGRVYGLVEVHHWCGNDRVRYHIARVDLAHMLSFVQEGNAPPAMVHGHVWEISKPGGRFGENGWEVGEYGSFRHWCRIVEEQAR